MGLFNYNRTYTLRIEDPLELGNPKSDTEESPLTESSTELVIGTDDLSSITKEGLEITDLHFEVNTSFNEKSSGSDSPACTIKIYNLSEETRKKVIRVNSPVILEAGYNGDDSVIFTGQVTKGYVSKEGQNVVTTLACKEGWTPLNGVRYSKTFPKETSYSDIFNDIISVFNNNGIASSPQGIKLNKGDNPPSELITVKSWSFVGYLRQAMDYICDELNFNWQIIHSKLFVYPKNDPEMVGGVILNSGNILSIKPSQEGTLAPSSSPQKQGLKLKTFLIGDLDTSKLVEIEPDDEDSTFSINQYAGKYRITNLQHSLSYEGGDWYTDIECENVEESEDNDNII